MKAHYLIAPLAVIALAGCTTVRPVAYRTAPATVAVAPAYVTSPTTVVLATAPAIPTATRSCPRASVDARAGEVRSRYARGAGQVHPLVGVTHRLGHRGGSFLVTA